MVRTQVPMTGRASCCAPAPRPKRAPIFAAACALALAAALLFWPATGFDFLNYDDVVYIHQNPVVLDGLSARSVLRAFSDTERGYWIPLTWISYMVDGELFGLSPFAFHRTNVVLFAGIVGLLPLLLWGMTGAPGRSIAAAALVAFHPLRVESVAWVAERKDVLSVFFLVLALACYLGWVRQRRFAWYLALAVTFAFGLMAKPSAVVFPAMLLVVDYFPLGRIGGAAGWRRSLPGALGEKLPLFALALAVAVVTLSTQHTARVSLPLLQRLELAALTPWIHLGKIFWPVGLGIRHFTPGVPRPLLGLGAALALLLVTLGAARLSRTRPYLAAAWIWYLISLFPVSWIFPAGLHWIADRFSFLPSVGLAVGVAWGSAGILPERKRALAAAAGAAVCVGLAGATHVQLSHWRDTEALFRRSVGVAPGDALSWAGLGGALAAKGRYEEALRCYERAVALNPARWGSQIGMLRTLLSLGRREDALTRLRETASADPPNAMALLALGTMLVEDGKAADALEQLEKALKLNLGAEDRTHGLLQRDRALELLKGAGAAPTGRR